MPKICLNMIVKNESTIIERLLTSVLPLIDTYCICDTGSDDNTIEIITKFFEKHQMSGKIIQEPFRDFGYNRNYAKLECLDMDADYLLLIDADMKLKVNTEVISEFKNNLSKDAYYIFQGNEGFFYKNLRLVINSAEYSYQGVTHEYLQTPKDTKIESIDKDILFINDIGDGGSKKNKFKRDIQLLREGLKNEPDNARYMFYLANSYLNTGQYHGAIETYKKRILMGGWTEEIWYSYYSIGKAYLELEDIIKAVFYWLEAYQVIPERLENIYEIIRAYRIDEKYRLAYSFYEIADYQRRNNYSQDHLFHDQTVYDYKLDYEFSILGFYCNYKKYNINESINRVLTYEYLPGTTLASVLSNYKYYSPALITLKKENHYTELLTEKAREYINKNTDFVMSTPSMVKKNNIMYVNIRCVNYSIDSSGNYLNKDTINTTNVISVYDTTHDQWEQITSYLMDYDKTYDGLYVGVEDIKLYLFDNELIYNGNRGLAEGNICVETGKIDKTNGHCVSLLLKKCESRLVETENKIEKNWILFENQIGELKVIHSWYPLKIGHYNKSTTPGEFVLDNEINTPRFFSKVRGSTNGILIDKELWFLTHIVSYEEKRRYYHMFVILNPDNYKVLRYSKLFTFENKEVEYTNGMVYFEKKQEFMIGYSIYDRESKFVCVNKSNIDTMFTHTNLFN